jgi:hypothetical protein
MRPDTPFMSMPRFLTAMTASAIPPGRRPHKVPCPSDSWEFNDIYLLYSDMNE